MHDLVTYQTLTDLSPIRGTRLQWIQIIYYVHYCTKWFLSYPRDNIGAVEFISLFESYPRDDDCIMYIIASSDFFLSYPRDNSAVELIDLSPIRGTRLYYVHYCIEWFFFCPIRGTTVQ